MSSLCEPLYIYLPDGVALHGQRTVLFQLQIHRFGRGRPNFAHREPSPNPAGHRFGLACVGEQLGRRARARAADARLEQPNLPASARDARRRLPVVRRARASVAPAIVRATRARVRAYPVPAEDAEGMLIRDALPSTRTSTDSSRHQWWALVRPRTVREPFRNDSDIARTGFRASEATARHIASPGPNRAENRAQYPANVARTPFRHRYPSSAKQFRNGSGIAGTRCLSLPFELPPQRSRCLRWRLSYAKRVCDSELLQKPLSSLCRREPPSNRRVAAESILSAKMKRIL